MKKFFLIVLMVMCIFITGCGKKKLTTYHEISYDDYKKMIENKESFPLVVGSSICSHCAMFKPTMELFISKNQVDVKYIDLSKLSEDDYNSFTSLVGIKSTPTTIFIENGVQLSTEYRIVGSLSYNEVLVMYKKMGYIG